MTFESAYISPVLFQSSMYSNLTLQFGKKLSLYINTKTVCFSNFTFTLHKKN